MCVCVCQGQTGELKRKKSTMTIMQQADKKERMGFVQDVRDAVTKKVHQHLLCIIWAKVSEHHILCKPILFSQFQGLKLNL